MRITADVEVINLLLPSFNMKAKGRGSKGQLSVGFKPGHKADGPYLMVCTKTNPAGQMFKVSAMCLCYKLIL
jgi:LRR-repeat protein 1